MNTSATTLEEIEEKIRAAEERRKQHEHDKMERLAEMEKHAEEVRANKEKIKAHPELAPQAPEGEEFSCDASATSNGQ